MRAEGHWGHWARIGLRIGPCGGVRGREPSRHGGFGGEDRARCGQVERGLHRQEGGRALAVARAYGRVDLVGERGDVADGDGPLVRVPAGRLTAQAELEGAVREGVQVQVAFGVPLDPGGVVRRLRFQVAWSGCTPRT